MKIIIFTTLLAGAFAAPGYLLDSHYVTPVKSTLTKSSQLVDHGSTTVIHAPVIPVHTVHTVPAVHTVHTVPAVHTVHAVPVHISHPITKTTITKNSQLVNHGGHEIHTIPVVHQPVHTYIHEPVHVVTSHIVPIKTKTTITKNSQSVNHGHKTIEVPEHHEIKDYPKHKATSSQYFKLDSTHVEVPHVELAKVSRTGDSAVSHHSSTVHETVSEVKSLPLYTLHH